MENKQEVITFDKAQASVYSDVKLYNNFFEMAKGLAKSDIVPDNYKNKPESCLVAIDVARQIGARSPLFVMQNLYVVKGKPSWSGQYCDALVRANFKNVKSEIKGEGMNRGCKVTAYDMDGNFCEGVEVTMKMANAEGWVQKTGSKWQTMPDLMLQYRAFAFFARVHCPEKLLGIHDEYESFDMAQSENKAINPFETKQEDIIDVEPVVEELVEEVVVSKTENTTENKLICSECGAEIKENVYKYSTSKFGRALCFDCQKKEN